MFPWARPIITETMDDVTATPFLITNSQSWRERNPEGENVGLDLTVNLLEPLNIRVALAKKNPLKDTFKTQEEDLKNKNDSSAKNKQEVSLEEDFSQKNDPNTDLPLPPTMKTPSEEEKTNSQRISKSLPSETRMVVIGNANFATDGWFQQQLNGDLFLNTLGWLANEKDSTLSISSKKATNRRINLTTFQAGLIGWWLFGTCDANYNFRNENSRLLARLAYYLPKTQNDFY